MTHEPEMLSTDRHRLLKEHLMSEIAQESAPTPVRPSRRLGWLVTPPLVVGLAVTVMLTGAGHSARPALVTPAAKPSASVAPSELLHRAAQSVAARPAAEVKDSQFLYQRLLDDGGGVPKHERSMWVAADGRSTGMIEDQTQFGNDQNPSGRIGYSQGSPTPDWPPVPSILYPTYQYLATLPTDPAQLLHQLYTEGNGKGSQPDLAAFRDAQRLFDSGMLTPAVSGALMEAMALTPGVTVVADEADAAGRHGVALVDSGQDSQQSLIFDRETGQFLGERSVLLHDLPMPTQKGVTGPNGKPISTEGRKAGDTFATAILQVGVADHAGDVPKS